MNTLKFFVIAAVSLSLYTPLWAAEEEEPPIHVEPPHVPHALIQPGANWVNQFWQAIRHGDEKTVQDIINEGHHVGHLIDPMGDRPVLVSAVEYGNPAIVQMLIDAGANVNTPMHFGFTPLHAAALEGHLDIVQILINAGANVNATDFQHRTPLQFAQNAGHQDIVEVLQEAGGH